MHKNLHMKNREMIGNITIGIPPLILSVVFSKVLLKLIKENRNIQFTIKEQGAYALKNELLLGNIHFATLLYPEHISNNIIDSFEIYRSELAIFCSPEHHFSEKEVITWKDLHKESMIIFDETFMIYQHLKESFERHQIYPDILCESSSWDYLYYTVKSNKNILTILPTATLELHPDPGLICRKIQDPVLWKVTLCRLKKANYSNVENYIFDEILKVFK